MRNFLNFHLTKLARPRIIGQLAAIIILCSTAVGQDLVVKLNEEYVGFDEKTDFVLASLTDKGEMLERQHWFKDADAGFISYDEANEKVLEYKLARDEIKDDVEIFYDDVYPPSPCYSLSKSGERLGLNSYFDIDGNEYLIDTPMELIKYLKFQITIKKIYLEQSMVSVSYFWSDRGLIENYSSEYREYYSVLRLVDYKPKHQRHAKFITYQKLKTHIRIEYFKFNMETFPKVHPIATNRTTSHVKYEDDFSRTIYQTPDFVEFRNSEETAVQFLEFLHRNTFLNLSKDIEEHKKEYKLSEEF